MIADTRAKRVASSTWLTAAAGMLLLVTAVVMMVCAAPRLHSAQTGAQTGAQHAGQPGAGPGGQLVSWAYLTPQAGDAGPVAHIPRGVRP
jgi:hypothetical protein